MAARGLQLLVSSHPASRAYHAGAALAAVAAGAGILAAAIHAVGAGAAELGVESAPDGATRALVLAGAVVPLLFWAVRLVVVRRSLPVLVLLLVAVPLGVAALASIGVSAPAGPFAYAAVTGGLSALAWLRRPAGVHVLEGGLRVARRTVLWRDVRGYCTLAVDHQWNGRRVGTTWRASLLLNDGAVLQLAPGVARAAALCETLEASLGGRLWRDAMERLGHGMEASFGAVVLDAGGIRSGRRQLGWVETRAATLEADHVCIHARGQSRPWARLRKRDLTAPNVLWRVIDARVTTPTAFEDAARAAEAAAEHAAAVAATGAREQLALAEAAGATTAAAAAAAAIRADVEAGPVAGSPVAAPAAEPAKEEAAESVARPDSGEKAP